MRCIVQLTDVELVKMSVGEVTSLAQKLYALPQTEIWEISVRSSEHGSLDATYWEGKPTTILEILNSSKDLFNKMNGG